MSEVETREPLLHHMGALFKAIKWIVVWIFVGAGGAYVFSSELVSWLEFPFRKVMGTEAQLIFLSPFEKVWVHLRVSFWTGLFCVLPAIYWALYQFICPALKKDERRKCHQMAVVFWLVFAGGIFLGQRYTVPLVLEALMSFKALNEVPFLSLSFYVNTVLGGLIATALLLELPVLMGHLSFWSWVGSDVWIRGRRIAFVANAALSAFLSPPDVLSMLLLMIPIQLLYECGIIISRVAEWGRYEKS
jgi:sec-independent protein translocase protein TatC